MENVKLSPIDKAVLEIDDLIIETEHEITKLQSKREGLVQAKQVVEHAEDCADILSIEAAKKVYGG